MSTVLIGVNISKAYGRQVVLDGVTFEVSDRARVALIGRNGQGKTTLLRVIAGDEAADTGTVTLVGGARLGVLRQDDRMPDHQPTVAYLEAESGEPEWECRKLAARFGLGEEEMALAPTQLSGGYQMRVRLVRLLLTRPEVLLLDEPVNYLDLPTMLHLEAFLRRFAGALIITSHDREVLDNLCTTTWEMERGRLTVFSGDPETYLDWKDERAEFVRKSNKKVREQMAHAQKFVDRFSSKASQASRAQSKIKYISKLRNKLKSLETDLPTAAFRIPCRPFVKGEAIRAEGLAVGYEGAAVLADVAFSFPRGAKVAVVGENGRGKSTLLKTMAGELAPVAGDCRWWHRADIGYFAQHAEEALPMRDTVLQVLHAAAPSETSAERILATAGAFLFREDDLEKSVGVLSGGEKARLRLARLILQEHNVLLLDEPTNHLDAQTVDVLAGALRDYDGTVVVVSHARTFVNAVAERIYEAKLGRLRLYPGTYEEYVAELAESAFGGGEETSGAAVLAEEKTARQAARAAERERQRERTKLERRLAELEKERSGILRFFFENPLDYAPDRQARLAALDEEIARAEEAWLKLAD
jgi:ATP-binding cassette subfamily F protein 3